MSKKSSEEIAKKIYERHQVLSGLFVCLGVSEQTAIDDACRIEHVISDETFAALKDFLKKRRADEAEAEA